jgi:hypothetical protein
MLREGTSKFGADVWAEFRRCGIEQGIDGLARHADRHAHDNAGDEKCGDGIGELHLRTVQPLADVGAEQADENGGGRPHIGREVQGVGLKRRALRLLGDTA